MSYFFCYLLKIAFVPISYCNLVTIAFSQMSSCYLLFRANEFLLFIEGSNRHWVLAISRKYHLRQWVLSSVCLFLFVCLISYPLKVASAPVTFLLSAEDDFSLLLLVPNECWLSSEDNFGPMIFFYQYS